VAQNRDEICEEYVPGIYFYQLSTSTLSLVRKHEYGGLGKIKHYEKILLGAGSDLQDGL
jgi:hypothetical protein